jgi:hypothetical protein
MCGGLVWCGCHLRRALGPTGVEIGIPTLAFFCLIPLAVVALVCVFMMQRALRRQIQAEENASDWAPLADEERRQSVYEAPAMPLIDRDGVSDTHL